MRNIHLRDVQRVSGCPSRGTGPAVVRAGGRTRSGCRAGAVLGALMLVGIACGCGGGGDAQPANTADGHVATTQGVDTSRTSTTEPRAGSGAVASSCKLLSAGDVTAAMRQPMKVSGDGGAICSYSATSDPSVVLYVQTFAGKAEAATDLQLEPSSEHIDGLGDDAFWNSTLDMVFVQSGDQAFTVTSPSLAGLSGDPQVSSPAMVGLAKIVLQNS